MDGPRDYHTKSSKSERERHLSYDITHMWNLTEKNDINELIYKTETDSQISKTNGNQREMQGVGGAGGGAWH